MKSLSNGPRFGGDFLPPDVLATIPPLYSSESDADPCAVVKLFAPGSGWTWWVIEASPVDDEGIMIDTTSDVSCTVDVLLFCLVIGHEVELGYTSLKELEEVRTNLELPIERDLYWKPTPLSKIRASLD